MLTAWTKLIEGANWEPDDDCQAVKGYALNALGRAAGSITGGNRMYIYYGIPKKNGTTKGGSFAEGLNNGTEDVIVINDTLDTQPGARKWRAFLHEVGHSGGLDHDSTKFNAYDAMDCAKIGNEEDDDDDDDNGGGGGGTWTPGETCTTETVWEEHWVSCSEGNGGDATCNPQCLPGLNVCTQKVYIPVEVVTCTG